MLELWSWYNQELQAAEKKLKHHAGALYLSSLALGNEHKEKDPEVKCFNKELQKLLLFGSILFCPCPTDRGTVPVTIIRQDGHDAVSALRPRHNKDLNEVKVAQHEHETTHFFAVTIKHAIGDVSLCSTIIIKQIFWKIHIQAWKKVLILTLQCILCSFDYCIYPNNSICRSWRSCDCLSHVFLSYLNHLSVSSCKDLTVWSTCLDITADTSFWSLHVSCLLICCRTQSPYTSFSSIGLCFCVLGTGFLPTEIKK